MVLELSGSNQQYTTQKAIALDVLGNHLGAMKLFKESLKVNPHDVYALDGLAHAFVSLKQYENASLVFDQVLKFPISTSGYEEA